MTDTKTELSLEEFRSQLKAVEVKCLICGYRAHGLVRHLAEAHKLSPGQYKQKFPVEKHPDAKFISPLTREFLKRFPRKAFKEETPLDEVLGLLEIRNLFEQGQFAAIAKDLPAQDPKILVSGAYEIPKENPDFEFDEERTEGLILALRTSKNVYISGPSGCGKTELVRQLHARFRRPLLHANMNGDMTAAKFVGAMRVGPQGTYFHYGMLPMAMRAGAVLLMDEADYTPSHIATVMNPVLDGSRQIFIEETGEIIHAAPGFLVVATGNTSGKGDSDGNYPGTEIMNTAFLDRFGIKLNADYMDSKKEVALIEKVAGTAIEKKEVEKLVAAANIIRETFKKGELALTISTRKLMDYVDFRKQGINAQSAMRYIFLNWLDGNDEGLAKRLIQQKWPDLLPQPKASKT